MPESDELINQIQQRIDAFLQQRAISLANISPDAAELLDFSRDFLSGGKRFRARFAWLGWSSVAGLRAELPGAVEIETITSICAALEIFHAAALIHDDIIDHSDTRRGHPSAHRRFEALHRGGGWVGTAAAFGEASAIILGDLLLGWSDELIDEALAAVADLGSAGLYRARQVRETFNQMRTDVTVGQYLDVLEENAWVTRSETELLTAAERVILFKSAKYSVEAPLLIGARLAGASQAQLSALSAFGLPLGLAFQLRDDLLGVFGDTSVTGKPSGDDLREGKRTVLAALTRERVTGSVRHTFDELLGDPELTIEQVLMIQQVMRDTGAVDEIERLIDHHTIQAGSALDEALLAPDVVTALRQLAKQVTNREY